MENQKVKSLMLEVIIHTAEMRRLQKEYFRGKSKFVLSKCVNEEKKVDRLLSEIISEEIIISNGLTVAEVIQQSFKFTES